MLQFSSEEIYLAIMKTLRIQQDDADIQAEEEFLLYKEGKIDLRRGKHQDIRYQRKLRDFSACFQICRKLYFCGGEQEVAGKEEFLPDFFSADYFGKCEELSPLTSGRSCISLCGLPSLILAIGGFKEDTLDTVDEYIMSLDKWVDLAPLNKPRRWAGSCLLPSRQAFCFCGTQGYLSDLNTIETMSLDCHDEWTLLPIQPKIATSFHLTAIPIEGGIFLFGGSQSAKYCSYLLSESGEILKDFSSDPLIPGAMCIGSCVKRKGKVFAAGKRRVGTQAVWGVKIFDGTKWSALTES